MRRSVAPVLLLALFVPLLAGCPTTEKRAYLVLGGTYAAGAGLAKYGDSYPALFHAFLQQELQEQLALRTLAVEGETTASMIGEGQLAKALAELRFRNQDDSPKNDTVVITLHIGGEELASPLQPDGACSPPATLDDSRCAAAFDDALEGLRLNLPVILRALRVAAGSDTKIMVINCFLPFPTAPETAVQMYSAVNDAIAEATRPPSVDAVLIDTDDAFSGREAELTTPYGEEGARVPNEAGHALLASLLEQAWGK